MRKSRRPEVGDLILVLYDNERTRKPVTTPYVGIVYELKYDKHGSARAFIEWTNERVPRDYDPDRGYVGVNIHNLRSKYRIFRDGEDIK